MHPTQFCGSLTLKELDTVSVSVDEAVFSKTQPDAPTSAQNGPQVGLTVSAHLHSQCRQGVATAKESKGDPLWPWVSGQGPAGPAWGDHGGLGGGNGGPGSTARLLAMGPSVT